MFYRAAICCMIVVMVIVACHPDDDNPPPNAQEALGDLVGKVEARQTLVNEALDYPDPVEPDQIYGSITITLTARGENTSADGKRTTKLEFSAGHTVRKFDDNGASYSESSAGTYEMRVKDDDVTTHGEWKANNAGAVPEDEMESALVGYTVLSKKLKLMRFDVQVPHVNGDNSNNYMISNGQKVNLSNKSVVSFSRLPYYSTANNTPYAKLAKTLEMTYDPVLFNHGNIFECPWDDEKGTAEGQLTVPVYVLINAVSLAIVYYPPFIEATMKNAVPEFVFKGNLTMRWQLSTKPIAGKLTFYPGAEYNKWQPQGGVDGNKVSVRVKIEPKNDESLAPKSRIDFYLRNVSTEPGTCLNSEDDGTDPDMKFVDSPGIIIDNLDPKHAYTEREDVDEATINIQSSDYGAFAELVAECKEHKLTAKYKETGEELLRLPLDKNKNHIADAWEEQEGILGKNLPAEWDKQDTPALNGAAGDGLSLYEEYRGLLVKGKHQRLSPVTKNLVVNNEAPLAEPGIALFAAATKLHVVVVKPGELLPDPNDEFDATVVNGRFKTAHAGLQHGLRIISTQLQGDGVGGQTFPRKAGAKVTHCPGEVSHICVSPSMADDLKEFGPAVVNRDVAHEIGHALGAQHHGEAAAPLVDRDLGPAMVPPQYTVYGIDGVLFTDRPLHLSGKIGVPGNEISGDVHCIMAYTGIFTWALHKDGNNYTYFNVGQTPPGAIFCASPVGTDINAPDHKPAPLFGNAAPGRGNCLGMMRVRDY